MYLILTLRGNNLINCIQLPSKIFYIPLVYIGHASQSEH